MRFEVSGTFREKKQDMHFVKKVDAASAALAQEKALTLLGSAQKLKRRSILIQSVKEVKQ